MCEKVRMGFESPEGGGRGSGKGAQISEPFCNPIFKLVVPRGSDIVCASFLSSRPLILMVIIATLWTGKGAEMSRPLWVRRRVMAKPPAEKCLACGNRPQTL